MKILIYILFVSSAFLSPTIETLMKDTFFPPAGLFAIFIIFLIFWWLRLDEKEGNTSGLLIKIFSMLIPPFVLPIHFFRTRGIKRGLVATLGMLGLIALYRLSVILGEHAAH